MRLLVLSEMFPCKRHPTSAIFFANLMQELAPKLEKLVIVTPRPYIPKFMTYFKKRWKKWYLDSPTSSDNGMLIIRPYCLYVRGISYIGLNAIIMQCCLYRLIKKLIAEYQIDIIMGHNLLPEGIAAGGLAKIFKLLNVTWCIGSDINDFAEYNYLNYYLTKRCLWDSQLILTTSKDLEEKVKAINNTNKVRTFYRGIDLQNFQNLPDKEILLNKLQLPSDKKYLLFVGRLIYDKGIYELVDVFKHVANAYPAYELILIGEEIEKEKLQAKLVEYGLIDKAHFKGIVSHKEVAHYMKISDLLILPTWAEGLPNVVMEAMAIGLPVVATKVGGIPEILEDGITGLSSPPKDVEQLTVSVIKMIEDKELREICIKNGKELISDKFDVKKNSLTMYNLLKDLKEHYSIPS
jgi:teichuronic acid biosynthesis glycosyltransferase TuaC